MRIPESVTEYARAIAHGVTRSIEDTRIERMDREHMQTRCTLCGECTRCNLRPCRNGAEHIPTKAVNR